MLGELVGEVGVRVVGRRFCHTLPSDDGDHCPGLVARVPDSTLDNHHVLFFGAAAANNL